MALIAAVVLATHLPFLDKAPYVDSFGYLNEARHFAGDPLAPYPGSDYYGRERVERKYIANPPLYSYLLAALFAAGWGDSYWALNLFSCAIALAAAGSIYAVARTLCSRPLAATLLSILSASFMVVSINVMTDTLWVALIYGCLALLLHTRRFNRGRGRAAWVGLLGGLGVMTRIVGLLVLPLLILRAFLWRYRLRSVLVALVVGLLPVIVWEIIFFAEHGCLHPTSRPSIDPLLPQINVPLMTVGWLASLSAAGFLPLMIPLILAGCRTLRLWLAPTLLLPVVMVGLFKTQRGTHIMGSLAPQVTQDIIDMSLPSFLLLLLLDWLGAVILAVLFHKGLSALYRWVMAGDRSVEAELTIFVFSALYLGILLVAPFPTVRYVMPLVPMIAIFFLRRLAESQWPPRWRAGLAWGGVAVSGLFGMALAYQDYRESNGLERFAVHGHEQLRRVAAEAGVPFEKEKIWFVGEWQFRLSMEREGYRYYVQPLMTPAKPGDLLVLPVNVHRYDPAPSLLTEKQKAELRRAGHAAGVDPEPVATLPVAESWLPIKLMDRKTKTGFYSGQMGLLPYSFSSGPLDFVEVYRFTEVERVDNAQVR